MPFRRQKTLSALTDPAGRPSGPGFKPGTQASLFNITAGGAAVETVTVDAQGKATFTTVKAPGQTYVIDGTYRMDAGTGAIVAPGSPAITLTAGNAQISIDWTDGNNGGSTITSHDLYRGTVSGNLQLVGNITTPPPYLDTGLVNGTPYFYQLVAKNAAGASVRSSEVSATASAPASGPILFLINWGQSNAQAAGSMTTANAGPNASQVMPNGYTTPNNRVKIWGLSNAFETYQPYVNSCQGFEAWGSEWAVAQTWLGDNPTGNVYIVKHAVGSTGLASGSSSVSWAPTLSGQHYATLTSRVVSAKSALAGQGIVINAANTVVLQSQGEQDATSQTYADAYQTNLTNFISTARSDWGASRWVIERLHIENGSQGRPGWITVYNAQTAVVLGDANVELVSTDGLPLYDEVHFSLASTNAKAKRAADVITRWWTKGAYANQAYIADVMNDRYIRSTTQGNLTSRKATAPGDIFSVSALSPLQRTYIDSTGVRRTMASTAANTPRFTFGDDGVRVLLHEGIASNICLWSRDLTNTVWVATNLTAVKDQTGRDATASSCTRITASANGGTILQSITATSATRVSSVDVKRLVGTGTLEMTQDNGTTWTQVATSTGWTRVAIPAQTSLVNPTIGFRIGTSGDSFAIDAVQCETGLFATTPIYTTTNIVTRQLEKIQMSGSEWSAATGTMVYRGRNGVSTTGYFICGDNNKGLIQRQTLATQAQASNDTDTKLFATPGSGSFTGTFGVALSYDGSGRKLCFNGGTVASDANTVTSRTSAPTIGAATNTNATTATGGQCSYVSWGSVATTDAPTLQALAMPNVAA